MSSSHHLTVIVIITITKKNSIPQKIEKKPCKILKNLQKTLEILIKSLTNLHKTRQKTLKHISTSIRLAKREICSHFLSFNLNAVTFNLLLILTLLLLILTERNLSSNSKKKKHSLFVYQGFFIFKKVFEEKLL
jgi:predicted component of viral defense system (DUF524 family)